MALGTSLLPWSLHAPPGIDPAHVEPEAAESGAETLAALAARDANPCIPLLVAPAGVAFGPHVPLVVDHVGAYLAVEMDIGPRGERFTATGWICEEHAAALRRCHGVSPGLRVIRARVGSVTRSWQYVEVTASRLFELSAIASPIRGDTSFLLAEVPGVKLWDPPGGERYTPAAPSPASGSVP